MDTPILQQRKQCKLILFPLPFQGHINPMLQLANILHTKGGFNISIIHTLCNSPDPSNYPQFTFHPISDGLSEIEASSNDPVLIIKLINVNCVEPFRKCLDNLFMSSSNDVKCLVTDANWHFTQSVSEKLKLPRIVMRTSSVCSFLAFAAFSVLREKGHLSNRDSKMEEPVQELPPLKVKDIPVIDMYNPDDAYDNIISMIEATKKASAIIFNTFKELEEPELAKLELQFPMPAFVIGPFHKSFSAAFSSLFSQDRSSISWLDTQAPKSVLYVSFGSVASIDSQKLQEVALGLANSLQLFLWVVRPGLVHGSEWLEKLPNGFLESIGKRGYIIKWAPQQEVLAHPAVGGFWTHCGWNSTLESICEGIPMICSPFFGDQLVNSRYVNDVWRIGVKLERGLERGEIESAIKRLMVEREGEEMRERVVLLKEKINAGLKLGGSSCESLDGLVDFISSLGLSGEA